ncbi:MAG: CHAT domain-containing protein [Spirulinaceae cyanobacterium RM2_2_10]|nr:CHAT domain-containing protein [Spirulinaceae cyanobacterium RM2_2_10]
MVHLATHGEFTSDPQTTNVLAYEEPITLHRLSEMLRERGDRQPEPLKLLVLSACETAVGDRRATLGMAGVAVQAGAGSTLASLFWVSDPATAALTKNFYQNLAQPQVTKAAALRQAQLQLLRSDRYARPEFWSPYILIGNWR